MHRIRFANQLRGLAALAVACSHLIGVFWAMPEVVSAATFSPAPVAPLPGIFWLTAHTWFNLGPFGVGLFFLISGLVIPVSLERHSRATFLVARLIRIFPTYAAVLLINMVVLYAASRAWSRPFAYSGWTLATNATLIYDLVGQPSIDLVNWTLSVELKFYLLIAVIAPWVRRGSVGAILGVAVVIAAANVAISAGVLGDFAAPPSSPTYTFSSHSLCVIFMLLGVAFNFHLRGRIGLGGLVGTLTVLLLLFLGTWQVSVWRDQYPIVTVNYLYALGLFGALYTVRGHVPRIAVLDAMAAISFPFYVLHSLLGFSILRALMVGVGIGYYGALPITVLGVAAVAWGVHRAVERPCIEVGRRLVPRGGDQGLGELNRLDADRMTLRR